MKRKTKYKPFRFLIDNTDDIFDIHKLEISKAIIAAIQYAHCKKNVKTIDFAELDFHGKMTVQLAIDSCEYLELIDKNIEIFEEFEEYELCAESLKLKEKINKIRSKKDLEKS